MNERIMDYAEQARLHAQKIYPEVKDIKDWGQLYHEKFAELIVKECAEAVKNSIWHLPRGYKVADQAEFVKKHFGVE